MGHSRRRADTTDRGRAARAQREDAARSASRVEIVPARARECRAASRRQASSASISLSRDTVFMLRPVPVFQNGSFSLLLPCPSG
jgi:hypothetical protein